MFWRGDEAVRLFPSKYLRAKDIMAAPVKSVKETIKLGDLNKSDCAAFAVVDNGGYVGVVKVADLRAASDDDLICHVMKRKFIRVKETALVSELVEMALNDGTLEYFLVDGHTEQGLIDNNMLIKYMWENTLEAEAKLDAVLNTVHEAVTIINEDDQVVGWSSQAELLYNLKKKDVLGKKIGAFFQNIIVPRAKNEDLKFKDLYHQALSDTHVLINAEPIKIGKKTIGGVSSERDITEIYYLHQELSKTDLQLRKLEREIGKQNESDKDPFFKIVGHSSKLSEARLMAKRVAQTTASILIRGESGTGKELFAEAIHKAGPRKDKPFIIVNCGAIPSSLFESELFGYCGGSFTGADKGGRAGKFEVANQGAIFLDEIGELHLDMQVKLLRVLQNKAFYRVGGHEPIEVDVHVISATNRNLETMVAEGKFREDLYYRLNVVSLDIPPLRSRKDDIPDLINIFMNEFCRKYNRDNLKLHSEVVELLISYSWPGNVRQLRNVIERMVILTEEGIVYKKHLPQEIQQSGVPQSINTGSVLNQETKKTEEELILRALEECDGNKSKTAKKLGIPRSTLYYKLKDLNKG